MRKMYLGVALCLAVPAFSSGILLAQAPDNQVLLTGTVLEIVPSGSPVERVYLRLLTADSTTVERDCNADDAHSCPLAICSEELIEHCLAATVGTCYHVFGYALSHIETDPIEAGVSTQVEIETLELLSASPCSGS